jgi:hypothetical protein
MRLAGCGRRGRPASPQGYRARAAFARGLGVTQIVNWNKESGGCGTALYDECYSSVGFAGEVWIMRKQFVAIIGLGLVGLAGAPSLLAQNLEMANPPGGQRAEQALPARGTSMTQVENRFGAPAERFAPVGQPPITRWVYPTFVVYFEYQHVVHTVATARP